MHSKYPRRLGWILILCAGFAWLSVGCSPQSLSMLLMPFSDNKIDPEYKLFAAGKELTVVIVSNFAQGELRDEVRPAENELAERVAEFLRKRCQENNHKIKIVSQTEVRNLQLKESPTGELTGTLFATAAGKKFKADYVLDLSIQSLDLYQKNTYPRMFRGATHIAVTLYKIDGKKGEQNVYSKELRTEYPREPVLADNSSAPAFRNLFLTKVARDLTKLLIAFPPEERTVFE